MELTDYKPLLGLLKAEKGISSHGIKDAALHIEIGSIPV